MKNASFGVIIVSGGYSSRMGCFKPFLKFGEKSAIEMLIDTYKSSGIENIIVVAGYKGNEIADKLKESDITFVQNENYEQGMFTSVVKGVKTLDTNISAFFMQPVDIPLVKKSTIQTLKSKYVETNKGIIYPDFSGNMGHPPLISCKYKDVISASKGEHGLKMILKEFSEDSICVPVIDKATLMDMDTKDDYEKLLRYYNSEAPDMEECCSILKLFDVPKNIVMHCRKVTDVAVCILNSIDNTRHELNECALTAAAMLHDIVKKEKNHAEVGEMLLKELGYDKVGSIIGSHTDIEVDENGRITENEILYLADKLVSEDKILNINQRFKKPLEKYKDSPEILRLIENRRDNVYKIIKKIETETKKGFIYG